jgi:tetratricopeptide (TPR) repeat protein
LEGETSLGTAYLRLPTGDRAANLQQAIDCYQEAIAIKHLPSWSRAHYLRNLGDAYSQQQYYPSAIAAYQQAIELDQTDPWLFNALGNAYSSLEQHEQAVTTYSSALGQASADEDKALLLRNRASSLISLNRLEEATYDCEMTQVLAPDHAYTHARLGDLAFARNDYASAVEHYTAAIQRQSEASFFFDRGLSHLAQGHPDQAQADYKAGIVLADSTALAEALKDLDKFTAAQTSAPGLDAIRALFLSPSDTHPDLSNDR